MRNIYTQIFGEDFMNKPVGSKHEGLTESEFMDKKIKEFKERNKLNK
jgi:hypothetical protein